MKTIRKIRTQRNNQSKNNTIAGLIIFVKNPVLGKCKTRLAASIGKEDALKVYINLLNHTQKVSQSLNCNRYLFYDTEIQKNDMWSNEHFIKSVQSDGDLGNRMSSAFQTVLTMENKAVIIGSDCPEINQETVNEAFMRLDSHDVVIGPTYDGGYYLIGMRAYHEELFNNIKWSSENVYRSTIEAIKTKGLSHFALHKMHDLDYKEDLDRFPIFMV